MRKMRMKHGGNVVGVRKRGDVHNRRQLQVGMKRHSALKDSKLTADSGHEN